MKISLISPKMSIFWGCEQTEISDMLMWFSLVPRLTMTKSLGTRLPVADCDCSLQTRD